jgi:replicative DNA helicase
MNEQERLDRYNAEARAIRDAINRRPLTDFYRLEKSRGGEYVCPICGSGTHKNKTGALSIRKADNRVTCFGSGHCFGEKGQDTLGALRQLLAGQTEREIFAYCGYQMTGTGRPSAAADFAQAGDEPRERRQKTAESGNSEPAHSFTEEIERYAAALAGSEGEAYLLGRGFTRETMQRFKLGYDAQRHCVTIPYNPQGSYYGRRSLLPEEKIPEGKGKYDKLSRAIAGVEPLFNGSALYSGDIVFVTEGALDAISIAQAGGAAVALNGTGFNKLIDQLKKKPTASAIVLCLDNDDAGRKATAAIGAALDEIGAFCVTGTAAIMGEAQDPADAEYRKDPNEVLQRNGADALRQAVTETADETRRQYGMAQQAAEAERQQHTGAGMVDAFLTAIQTRKYEPMPTGITDIDRALDGGFMRQWLVLLGAAPGAGKTALAQWIFEGMAKRGTACVYLNLEMSREQILARSFSRLAARRGHKIRTNVILQGYRWTDEQRAAIMDAAGEYKDTIAPRMIYNPDGVTANLDSILAYIEAEAQRAEKAEMPAPCVVLDYLQIVSGEPREDAASVIKRAVSGLKDYAMKHNTLVFVIIAHNRASNSTGAVSMESGRDTSALEYSADLQLALTFTKCLKRDGQKAKSPDDLTDDERKEITLRIVKGRFGGMGREVDLHFNGETMTYTQTCKDFIEVDEPTPFDDQQTQQPRKRF